MHYSECICNISVKGSKTEKKINTEKYHFMCYLKYVPKGIQWLKWRLSTTVLITKY